MLKIGLKELSAEGDPLERPAKTVDLISSCSGQLLLGPWAAAIYPSADAPASTQC